MSLYVPPHFRVDDRETANRLIAENGFAMLTCMGSDGLQASHLPLVLDDGGNVLLGHFARANPQWRCFDGATEALAVFWGPHAYVSPRWMSGDGNVPTWNYQVVQVTGRPRLIEDAGTTAAVLDRLVAQYEPGPDGWRTADLADGRFEGMIKAIVAFEMPIESLACKFKLSQNKTPADRAGVIEGLREAGNGVLADRMSAK